MLECYKLVNKYAICCVYIKKNAIRSKKSISKGRNEINKYAILSKDRNEIIIHHHITLLDRCIKGKLKTHLSFCHMIELDD